MSKKSENWRLRSGGDLGQFCGFFRRPSGGVLRSFPLRVYLLLPAVSWPLFINQGRDNSKLIRESFIAVTVSLEIESIIIRRIIKRINPYLKNSSPRIRQPRVNSMISLQLGHAHSHDNFSAAFGGHKFPPSSLPLPLSPLPARPAGVAT